jgi:hypothetical protein
MKRNVSVVRLIVATRSSGPPASGKIIKEMPGSVASGTPYRCLCLRGDCGLREPDLVSLKTEEVLFSEASERLFTTSYKNPK